MKHLEIVNSKAKNPSSGSFDNGLWGGIGIDGKSVISGEIKSNGHLVFTLSDNSQIDCGPVNNLFVYDDTPTLGSHNLVDSGHIKLALNQKVDIVAGKGLSTEDYTTAEKEKLSMTFIHKGSVDNYEALPSSGNTIGDVWDVQYRYDLTTQEPSDWSTNYTSYYVKSGNAYTAITGETVPIWTANTYYSRTEDGTDYVWNSYWDSLSGTVSIDSITNAEIDIMFS